MLLMYNGKIFLPLTKKALSLASLSFPSAWGQSQTLQQNRNDNE